MVWHVLQEVLYCRENCGPAMPRGGSSRAVTNSVNFRPYSRFTWCIPSVANNTGLPRRAHVEAQQPSLSGRLYGLPKLLVGQAAVDFRVLRIADLTRRMVLGHDVDVRVCAQFTCDPLHDFPCATNVIRHHQVA